MFRNSYFNKKDIQHFFEYGYMDFEFSQVFTYYLVFELPFASILFLIFELTERIG